MSTDEYVCAFTGIAASDAELSVDADDEDDLGEMPESWTRVTLERRVRNPEYVLLQQVMEGTMQQGLSSIPAEQRDLARPAIAMAIRAQFAAILQEVDPYLVETEVVYVAPPSADSGAAEGHAELRALLGLPAFTAATDPGEALVEVEKPAAKPPAKRKGK